MRGSRASGPAEAGDEITFNAETAEAAEKFLMLFEGNHEST
jgi:hypothetical protein